MHTVVPKIWASADKVLNRMSQIDYNWTMAIAKVIEDHKTLPTVSRFALWLSDSFEVTFDRLVGEEVAQ